MQLAGDWEQQLISRMIENHEFFLLEIFVVYGIIVALWYSSTMAMVYYSSTMV